jgi:dynein heavy chain
MVVPDFELICEIMLVAEGFQEARLLARKFITLYTLCQELLSKQDHYDWGLRAIKSVLVVAGSLKVSVYALYSVRHLTLPILKVG